MFQPPSPRSPPLPPLDDEMEGQSTPLVNEFSFSTSDRDLPESPSLTSSVSSPAGLGSSTGSTSSTDSVLFVPGHKSSSSFNFRQRSSPLEPSIGHQPPSSAGGSGSSKPSSALRHARPVAPSRVRRTSGDQSALRSASAERTSPLLGGNRSGTNSPTQARPASAASNRAKSPLERDTRRTSSSGIPRPLSSVGSNSGRHQRVASDSSDLASPLPRPRPSSPPLIASPTTSEDNNIDTTSYHAPPISPVTDASPQSALPSSFNNVGAYSFSELPPTGTNLQDYFAARDGTPDRASPYSLRRDNSLASTNSSGESRPGSFFVGEASGMGGGYRPDSMFGGQPISTVGGDNSSLSRHAAE